MVGGPRTEDPSSLVAPPEGDSTEENSTVPSSPLPAVHSSVLSTRLALHLQPEPRKITRGAALERNRSEGHVAGDLLLPVPNSSVKIVAKAIE